MRFVVLAFLLVSGLSFSACDKKDEDKSYSYEFESNGCKTGRHSFGSVGEMCEALQDENLNRGCALGLRIDYFDESCGEAEFQLDGQGIGNF